MNHMKHIGMNGELSASLDERFMLEAISEAKKAADLGEVPVGAVVVCGGNIIVRAHNSVEGGGDASLHAELSALREAARVKGDWRLSDCALYVTLEPCAMCAGACVLSRIGMIAFGAYDENLGACSSVLDVPMAYPSGNVKCVGGIMERECALLLTDFFKRRRDVQP